MKLFDIANMGRKGHWIVAENEEDAKAVFSKLFPRSKIRDITELEVDPKDKTLVVLLNGKDKGWIGKTIHLMTTEQMTKKYLLKQRVKMPPDKWFFIKNTKEKEII
jgi:hypothetical protein